MIILGVFCLVLTGILAWKLGDGFIGWCLGALGLMVYGVCVFIHTGLIGP